MSTSIEAGITMRHADRLPAAGLVRPGFTIDARGITHREQPSRRLANAESGYVIGRTTAHCKHLLSGTVVDVRTPRVFGLFFG